MSEKKVKELGWVVSSKKDLMGFPLNVRKEMGHALYIAQQGGKHKDAKPLKGFGGATVLEVVQNDGNGTYRTMYTVQFEQVIYVLHAFQKKSKTGIKTSKQDMDLVEKRLAAAQHMHKEWLTRQNKEGNQDG
jgi:phage-related protein